VNAVRWQAQASGTENRRTADGLHRCVAGACAGSRADLASVDRGHDNSAAGGAKGAAHVGVITLLEELRIPIDCVVGTSMGALVGGTYAAGQTAPELQQSITSISWADTIAFEGYREKLPMRPKLAGVTNSNNLQFGVKDGRVTAPHSFINTQYIE
jgi:hypothetical protein